MSKKKVHVIYVTEDGVAALCCGVGTIAKQFIASFPDIANHFSSKGFSLKLSVISIQLMGGGVGVNDDLLKTTRNVCNQYRGKAHLIRSQIKPADGYSNTSYTFRLRSLTTTSREQGKAIL